MISLPPFSTLRVALRHTPLYPNQRFGQRGKAALQQQRSRQPEKHPINPFTAIHSHNPFQAVSIR